jgi:signal transduction histidine kinase
MDPSSQKEKELAQVAKEMYERNVELAIKNRTFTILQNMYAIINKHEGVRDTAVDLIEEVIRELNFQLGLVMLIDSKKRVVKTIASSHSTELPHITPAQIRLFSTLEVSLRDKTNHCVDSAVRMHRRMTNMLNDICVPRLSHDDAHKLQEAYKIETILFYPLIFSSKPLGVLVLGIGKHIGSLSRAEREALSELSEVISIALQQSKLIHHIKESNKHLRDLDVLKDEFVSIASHELRTPMTAIKSYLWMALYKSPQKLDPVMKKYLEISYNSTERLIRLVNAMLTVSRMERNKIELKMSDSNLMEVAQMLYDELKVTATEKQVDFLLTHDVHDTYTIFGDKDKIREVLQNLVGNALKFTPPGGKVTIHIAYRSKQTITTSVTDTGSGIPKESMSKLFQKFSKIDYSYAHHSSQPGTGLGLYISKQIATLHKGSIEVKSTVGVGSTFTLVLPVHHEKGGT